MVAFYFILPKIICSEGVDIYRQNEINLDNNKTI